MTDQLTNVRMGKQILKDNPIFYMITLNCSSHILLLNSVGEWINRFQCMKDEISLEDKKNIN